MFNDGFSLHAISNSYKIGKTTDFLCDVDTFEGNAIFDKDTYKEAVLDNEMFPVDSEVGDDIWDVYGNLICGDDVFDEDDDNEF